MSRASFDIGVTVALTKIAALDQEVHEAVVAVMPKQASLGDELEKTLPGDGALEETVATLEDNFKIQLPSDVVFRLFAQGTVADLEQAIVDQLMMGKTAGHQYYMKNKARIQQKNRLYRISNLQKIRRHSRRYRRMVQRRVVRPRRRVGTPGAGYKFVVR